MLKKRDLIDPFNRAISYLRISVTDRCDFRCTYCMSEKMKFLPKKDVLSLEELDQITSAFIELGVQKLRVTGGEPLVRKEILSFFKNASRHLKNGSLKELTLTTNGSQLDRYAQDLFNYGVRRVNVSLDTLNEKKFKLLTRLGDIDKVIKGIMKAKSVGLKVKINFVALKNVNEDELFQMLEWCENNQFDLTFIEVMPLGDFESEHRLDQYWSLMDLQSQIEQKWTLKNLDLNTGGPARYFQILETNQKIGFITPLSHNFCATCNRVRLTCTGELHTCLGQNNKTDLRDIVRRYPDDIEMLKHHIEAAIFKKPKAHSFSYDNDEVSGQLSRYMSHTGG